MKFPKIDPVHLALLGQTVSTGIASAMNRAQSPAPFRVLQKPTVQLMDADYTQIDEMEADLEDARRSQLRAAREQTGGQMSNLLLANNVINSAADRRQKEIDLQKIQMMQQEKQINTNLMNQNRKEIAQINNQEILMDQQNLADFAKQQTAAKTAELQAYNQLMAGFAQYEKDKDYVERQEAIQRESIAANTEMNLLVAQIMQSQGYREKQDYKIGQSSFIQGKINEAITKTNEELGTDYNDVNKVKKLLEKSEFEFDKRKEIISDQNKYPLNEYDKLIPYTGEDVTSPSFLLRNQEYKNLLADQEKTQKSVSDYKNFMQKFQEYYPKDELSDAYDEQYRKKYGIKTLKDLEDAVENMKNRILNFK